MTKPEKIELGWRDRLLHLRAQLKRNCAWMDSKGNIRATRMPYGLKVNLKPTMMCKTQFYRFDAGEWR